MSKPNRDSNRLAISVSPSASRYLVLIATILGVFLIGVSRPTHDWDMIGYVASAYQLDGYRGSELLSRTFGDVRAAVDADTFQILIEGEGLKERNYRQTVYKDPRALEMQTPFYSIRIVYVELIRVLGGFWKSYSTASEILSASFAALAVALLARIVVIAGVPFGMLPVVVLVSGISELARVASPDSMAVFFALLCLASFMRRGAVSFLGAAILPLIRTDLVLLSALMMLCEFASGRRRAASIAIVLSIAAYVAVNKWAGNYGWLNLVSFTVNGPSPYPAEVKALNWKDDIKAYINVAYDFMVGGYVVVYLIATYFIVRRWVEFKGVRGLQLDGLAPWIRSRAGLTLYVLPVAYVLVHVLLFPHVEARYFVFSYALVLVCILSLGVVGASGRNVSKLEMILEER